MSRYEYDSLGNFDKIIYANGIVADYNFDLMGRLIELIHSNDNGTPNDTTDDSIVHKFVYQYDNTHKTGEIAFDKNGNASAWNWKYDALGRLVQESHDNHDDSLDYVTKYVYDIVGNRVEKATDSDQDGVFEESIRSQYDVNDRLLNETKIFNGESAQSTSYGYNGTEQVQKTVTNLKTSTIESRSQMKYDVQGRMSSLEIRTYVDGRLVKTVIQEFTYDSTGIRVRQVESEDSNADGTFDTTKTTDYLYASRNPTGYTQVLEEKSSHSDGTVKTTTYTIGLDVLAQYNTINGYLSFLADGHGSTRGIANDSGQIVQEYNYDAYGNALGFDPGAALTNILYSGEQYNVVSGLQYLRARWYNPQSGTFNSLDPFSGNAQNPQSYNKYAYAHNNPIGYVDPSGAFISLVTTNALRCWNALKTWAAAAWVNKILPLLLMSFLRYPTASNLALSAVNGSIRMVYFTGEKLIALVNAGMLWLSHHPEQMTHDNVNMVIDVITVPIPGSPPPTSPPGAATKVGLDIMSAGARAAIDHLDQNMQDIWKKPEPPVWRQGQAQEVQDKEAEILRDGKYLGEIGGGAPMYVHPDYVMN